MSLLSVLILNSFSLEFSTSPKFQNPDLLSLPHLFLSLSHCVSVSVAVYKPQHPFSLLIELQFLLANPSPSCSSPRTPSLCISLVLSTSFNFLSPNILILSFAHPHFVSGTVACHSPPFFSNFTNTIILLSHLFHVL